MKRTLAIALALIMLLGILAGCGNTKSGSSKGMEEITILYPGDETDRFTEFLNNEFAERMKNDLNMKVNVVFVPWDQYWDKKDIMLANQEAIDLYWDGLPDLSTMVNKKQCQPIDELLEKYGQDMLITSRAPSSTAISTAFPPATLPPPPCFSSCACGRTSWRPLAWTPYPPPRI